MNKSMGFLAWIVTAIHALQCAGELKAQEAPGTNVTIVQIEGRVEFSRRGSTAWDPAYTNQALSPGDQMRTLANARAVVRMGDLTLCRVGEFSRLVVPGENSPDRSFGLSRGRFYFFHRAAPGTTPIKTPTISAVVRGTEYVVEVAEDGATTLTVIDGEVAIASGGAEIHLLAKDRITATTDRTERTKTEHPYDLIQWVLYYPAVLDLKEVKLDDPAWSPSAEAYSRGAIRRALELLPANPPATVSERLFAAAVLLAAGKHTEATLLLDFGSGTAPEESVRRGIRNLIASVIGEKSPAGEKAATATESLGQACLWQSQGDLDRALAAVREALAFDPQFALARGKLSELLFSHGLLARAHEEAARARSAAPELAATFLIEGFYLAAQNKTARALELFSTAISLEPAMGEAWLGRGLVLIRRGAAVSGRGAIETAVTLEPTRSMFRSYLAKAYYFENHLRPAAKDLEIARQHDPADPTGWLYSGLLREKENDLNRAISDLDESKRLNGARRNFRSGLLLDEDRAVRSVNLARIYSDAGLEKESLREAVSAVAYDYANYSAHSFLSHSYANLRDPRQTTLRFETPWLSEFLLANLLAPVGGTPLSTHLSTHEYGSLFERDRFGFASTTEYFSGGEWFQAGSHYGRFGSSSYSIDAAYSSLDGSRPNHDFEQLTFSAQVKQQLTLQDSLYLQGVTYDAEGGDLAARYDPDSANRTVRFEEEQRPLALIGYRREWQPGVDTLAVAGFFHDDFQFKDDASARLLFSRNNGAIDDAATTLLSRDYSSEMRFFHSEAQQIVQRGHHTMVAGLRYQRGMMEARNADAANASSSLVARAFLGDQIQDIEANIERFSAYLYDHWEIVDRLVLIGGLDYSSLKSPVNGRFGPLISNSERTSLVSPKAGFVWSPRESATFRGSYSRSLGGVSFERSFSLEPSQIAGFTQNYRSLHPESLAGSNSGEEQEVIGLAWDQQFATGTYAGVSFEMLRGSISRSIGAYELVLNPGAFDLFFAPAQMEERLRVRERTLQLDLQQLVGRHWSVGAAYRMTHAELENEFDIPLAAGASLNDFAPRSSNRALLHHLQWNAVFNHPTGYFSRGELNWFLQDNDGGPRAFENDNFWQLNLYAGYRFWQRRAEIRLGLLNVLGQDYRVSPLNFWQEPYRDRTFAARLRIVW